MTTDTSKDRPCSSCTLYITRPTSRSVLPGHGTSCRRIPQRLTDPPLLLSLFLSVNSKPDYYYVVQVPTKEDKTWCTLVDKWGFWEAGGGERVSFVYWALFFPQDHDPNSFVLFPGVHQCDHTSRATASDVSDTHTQHTTQCHTTLMFLLAPPAAPPQTYVSYSLCSVARQTHRNKSCPSALFHPGRLTTDLKHQPAFASERRLPPASSERT